MVLYRILADHTSVSDVQSQALYSLKDKLNEAEVSLRRECDSHQKAQVSLCVTPVFALIDQTLLLPPSSTQIRISAVL